MHERAALTHTYARLLSKWDKREAAGRDMARDADMLFESLRADKDKDKDGGAGGAGAAASLGAMVSYPLRL